MQTRTWVTHLWMNLWQNWPKRASSIFGSTMCRPRALRAHDSNWTSVTLTPTTRATLRIRSSMPVAPVLLAFGMVAKPEKEMGMKWPPTPENCFRLESSCINWTDRSMASKCPTTCQQVFATSPARRRTNWHHERAGWRRRRSMRPTKSNWQGLVVNKVSYFILFFICYHNHDFTLFFLHYHHFNYYATFDAVFLCVCAYHRD